MDFLLRIKAWQAFMLTFGLYLITAGINLTLVNIHSPLLYYFQFVVVVSNITVFLFHQFWMLMVMKELDKRIPEKLQEDTSIFTLVFYINLVPNLLWTALTIIGSFTPVNEILGQSVTDFFLLEFFGVRFFTILTILSSLYFSFFLSKLLVIYEVQKRGTTFGDHMGYFFHFLIYPLGIWSLQPRINKFSIPEPEFDPETPLDQNVK